MSPELLNDDGPLTEAFEAVDAYRRRFDDAPETLSNPILAGTLLLPLGLLRDEGHRYRYHDDWEREAPHMLGQMQVARKDIEKLRHLLSLQKRLLETDAPARVQRALIAPRRVPRRPHLARHPRRASRRGRALGDAVARGTADAGAEDEGARRRRRPRRRRPPGR